MLYDAKDRELITRYVFSTRAEALDSAEGLDTIIMLAVEIPKPLPSECEQEGESAGE